MSLIPFADLFPRGEGCAHDGDPQGAGPRRIGRSWPITAILTCVRALNEPVVYFVPNTTPPAARAYLLDTDLLASEHAQFGEDRGAETLWLAGGLGEEDFALSSPWAEGSAINPPRIVKGSELYHR